MSSPCSDGRWTWAAWHRPSPPIWRRSSWWRWSAEARRSRGALDRLPAWYSPLGATLLLGVIWGAWHLPIYGLAFVGPMMFVVFSTWLWNRTRSLLLCVLLHASFTPALEHVVLTDDTLTVDIAILGTLLAGALVLIALTRGRLGLDRPVTTPASTWRPVRAAAGALERSG